MDEKLTREPASRPGEPTSAPPGSSRKIRVLMERAARKEPLFHPRDNRKRRLPRRRRDQTTSPDDTAARALLALAQQPSDMAG